jgi:hypothetical protein
MPGGGTPEVKDLETPVGNPLRYPRRVLIQILASAFSEPELIDGGNPFLFVFDHDKGEISKDSKLVIADTYSDELQATEPRPMIIASRGDFGFLKHGIGAKENTVSFLGAKKKYADMTEMPVILNCLSRRDIESEDLAWAVTGIFRYFKEEIRRRVNVQKLSDPRVGAPIVVKADSQLDLFLTPISLMVHQASRWEVKKPLRLGTFEYQFFLPGEDEPIHEVK